MDQPAIKQFILNYAHKCERTIVIVDYGNVEKWKNSLKWKIGIRELARLVKCFSQGNKELRRFYYGADYGQNEKATTLVPWSKSVLDTAKFNHFEVIDKKVKYIHDINNLKGFSKKCDLDVEMSIDLVKMRDSYDTIILFSGDGDLMYAVKYLKDFYGKECYVFGARDHVGREVQDAKNSKDIEDVFYADDFEYRLNSNYQARS